jgi:hypothetical protein
MDIHDDVSHNVNNDVTHDVDHNARDVICDIQFSIFFYCVFCLCCKCKPNILLIWCWLVGHFTLSHDLRGTIIKIMVALCFLAPISNKFVEFVLDL